MRSELADACEIVGEAGTPEAAIATILESKPDVVLLDVHLPEGGGVAVLDGLRAAEVTSPVLALSVSDASEDVVPMIRAGALGYVTKTIETEELIQALRMVAAGDAYFSPRLAAFVLQAFSAPQPTQGLEPGLEALTPREREVLHHLARGYAYKQIGVAARHQCPHRRVARGRGAAQAAADLTPRGHALGGQPRPDRPRRLTGGLRQLRPRPARAAARDAWPRAPHSSACRCHTRRSGGGR